MHIQDFAPNSSIDPLRFRETLGQYPTGVAVITGLGSDGSPLGMVVGTFASVSLEPPLVSFMPMKSSSTFARLRESQHFCVNVLASDQEAICRKLSGKTPDKFSGIDWHPSPSGLPIIDGVVAWIECSYDQVIEAGDHFIVLGTVTGLATERPHLPLLFFQGGYGQFSLSSLVAASSHDFAEAIRLAEAIRGEVERCAKEHNADCAVLTRVGSSDGVGQVVTVSFSQAASRVGDQSDSSRVGNRVPHLAPLGAVFLEGATEVEVEAWLSQVRRMGDQLAIQALDKLTLVRERGYSFSLASSRVQERLSLLEQYSSPEVLPQQDRQIRELISESLPLYDTELESAKNYDVYTIAVPVVVPNGPRLALRLSRLPGGVPGGQIEHWATSLRRTADEIVAKLSGPGDQAGTDHPPA